MSEQDAGAPAPTPAVDDCHALLLWIIPQIDKLPRQRRFTLGERLESELLEVLRLLVTAAYQRNREALLSEANVRISVCRHLWRLGLELKVVSLKSYEHGAQLMTNLGRQVGGWLKAAKRSA
ncbi:MAG: diversity-generating retroelement protein Avd [Gammaproteobacteria bacterium]|nr:MAG: diversity-generating retroelement protein Avd [Gammaproteobacteria bacterium]